ncbi:J domain-containing protein [Halpernia frigidisoli]|uniref:DnaJ domain-containing protein n=1 Tax=Halpernia frigidisoli TaxID=1125876 RepID=A0A1I3D593_9FLAO|nr:J domain-containing protein [Halpernia frigidisoli]SFH81900.1 DnaJ domain-containing protein [Halpernia frigidisoli]
MKDYYYFLGVSANSSDEEIKKAYRKLSLKYHPDKTDNDEFFENRFREVQEAYETLSNHDSRKIYDANFSLPKQNTRNNLPPYIKTFSANKIRVKKGEEVIITWQTQNADVVKILPFGLEKSYGERTFKITEFVDGKFQILLHAMNSSVQKTVVKGITIIEVFENDREKIKSEVQDLLKPQKKSARNPSGSPKIFRYLLIVFILIMLLFFVLNNF